MTELSPIGRSPARWARRTPAPASSTASAAPSGDQTTSSPMDAAIPLLGQSVVPPVASSDWLAHNVSSRAPDRGCIVDCGHLRVCYGHPHRGHPHRGHPTVWMSAANAWMCVFDRGLRAGAALPRSACGTATTRRLSTCSGRRPRLRPGAAPPRPRPPPSPPSPPPTPTPPAALTQRRPHLQSH